MYFLHFQLVLLKTLFQMLYFLKDELPADKSTASTAMIYIILLTFHFPRSSNTSLILFMANHNFV